MSLSENPGEMSHLNNLDGVYSGGSEGNVRVLDHHAANGTPQRIRVYRDLAHKPVL